MGVKNVTEEQLEQEEQEEYRFLGVRIISDNTIYAIKQQASNDVCTETDETENGYVENTKLSEVGGMWV